LKSYPAKAFFGQAFHCPSQANDPAHRKKITAIEQFRPKSAAFDDLAQFGVVRHLHRQGAMPAKGAIR